MIKAIIPCAGFGTRVGMKPNESKEMLIWDKEAPNRVIDYSLNLCKEAGLEPLVISRAEKEDLNTYLRGKGIEPVIIEPKGEWMDSILAAINNWNYYNILILPDTRFDNSVETIRQMSFHLIDCEQQLTLGLHTVEDPTKWCVYDRHGVLYEKAKVFGPPRHNAFGIVGFEKYEGMDLFENLSEHKQSSTPKRTQLIKIRNFIDITRGEYVLNKG